MPLSPAGRMGRCLLMVMRVDPGAALCPAGCMVVVAVLQMVGKIVRAIMKMPPRLDAVLLGANLMVVMAILQMMSLIIDAIMMMQSFCEAIYLGTDGIGAAVNALSGTSIYL